MIHDSNKSENQKEKPFLLFGVLCSSSWGCGCAWGGILGGILGGIARAGFSHRESPTERVISRTPLIIRTVCAISSDKGPCARHTPRALRRACGQGAVLSLCAVRPGSGRFGVGFWVGFWVGSRARDFPTERVLSRTPLIIRTVDQNPKQLSATLMQS